MSEESINIILQHFNELIPLNQKESKLVSEKFHYRLYRKNHYLLQEGDICRNYHFIIKGCVRMHRVDKAGKIHTLQFAAENSWITEINSFYNLESTIINIDALEQTEVLQISRDDLISLYRLAPKFDRIFRILTEINLSKLQQRHLQAISCSAEERYTSFLEAYPMLQGRISQVHIAAFLGITPEFLCRMRSRKSKSRLQES
ncbi:Crp/Fnr family transcriptional regulator [Flavobacterium soyae]|uniref:Crp/Fnr family transcriptional regulator n=1 Tax=Flavobacterium soyae TaxID=2903098 RepID=A0ABZ2UBE8_9FLAO